MTRLVRLALIIATLIIALGGCKNSGGGPPKRCTKSYTRCRLAAGPLGVCMPMACPAGKKRPCFRCAAQH